MSALARTNLWRLALAAACAAGLTVALVWIVWVDRGPTSTWPYALAGACGAGLAILAVAGRAHRRPRGHVDRPDLEALVHDRTRELEASHELLRRADRLASIGTLTAGIGHDINNVLFPLKCRLAALDDDAIPDRLVGVCRSVTLTVEYLQQLSDGLRLFALDPERAHPTSASTDVASWWDQVSRLFEGSLDEAVRFEHHIAPGLAHARVAPHRLTQAVLNLLVNASDAMPEGGRIEFRALPSDDGTSVVIEVEDEGAGMTEEVREQALDPFFTTKQRTLATGLGLSLVSGVVRSSDGHLHIDSAPGVGTTVRMEFAAAEAPSAGVAAVPRGSAVVAIEDARRAAWITELLQSSGFRVEPPDRLAQTTARLIVVEPTARNLEPVRSFLTASSDHRAIVVGPAGGAWLELGALIVEDVNDLATVRQLLRAEPVPS